MKDVNDVVQVFLLLPFNKFYTFSSVSIADFEWVNVSWVKKTIQKKKAVVKQL